MVAGCNATTTAGAPCSARPVLPSGWCYWHDPATAAARDQARRDGGAARSNKARARKQYADGALTPVEVEGLLGTTLRAVIAGRLEPGVGNAVASLARAAMAVRDAGEVERLAGEVDELKAMLARRPA